MYEWTRTERRWSFLDWTTAWSAWWRRTCSDTEKWARLMTVSGSMEGGRAFIERKKDTKNHTVLVSARHQLAFPRNFSKGLNWCAGDKLLQVGLDLKNFLERVSLLLASSSFRGKDRLPKVFLSFVGASNTNWVKERRRREKANRKRRQSGLFKSTEDSSLWPYGGKQLMNMRSWRRSVTTFFAAARPWSGGGSRCTRRQPRTHAVTKMSSKNMVSRTRRRDRGSSWQRCNRLDPQLAPERRGGSPHQQVILRLTPGGNWFRMFLCVLTGDFDFLYRWQHLKTLSGFF